MSDLDTILDAASSRKPCPTFYDRLTAEQQAVMEQIRRHLQTHGGNAHAAARKIKELYDVSVTVQTIADWLKS